MSLHVVPQTQFEFEEYTASEGVGTLEVCVQLIRGPLVGVGLVQVNSQGDSALGEYPTAVWIDLCILNPRLLQVQNSRCGIIYLNVLQYIHPNMHAMPEYSEC